MDWITGQSYAVFNELDSINFKEKYPFFFKGSDEFLDP